MLDGWTHSDIILVCVIFWYSCFLSSKIPNQRLNVNLVDTMYEISRLDILYPLSFLLILLLNLTPTKQLRFNTCLLKSQWFCHLFMAVHGPSYRWIFVIVLVTHRNNLICHNFVWFIWWRMSLDEKIQGYAFSSSSC